MNELISGKEALIAKLQGKDVQYESSSCPDLWNIIGKCDLFEIDEWINEKSNANPITFKFRLKPRTITVNGIEVPGPFEPKVGEFYYHIELGNFCGYKKREMIAKTCIYSQVGVWRTEEEIKQVVEALRSVFK